MTKDDILICDPEAEYFPLVNRLEGQVIKISPTSTQYVNPMDINLNYSEDDNPLALKIRLYPVVLRTGGRRAERSGAGGKNGH